MDLIQGYSSGEDKQPQPQQPSQPFSTQIAINPTPDVSITSLIEQKQAEKEARQKQYQSIPQKSLHLSGTPTQIFIDDAAFSEQFHAYQNHGLAIAPDSKHYVINPTKIIRTEEGTKVTEREVLHNREQFQYKKKQGKINRNWDPCSDGFSGPWATREDMQKEDLQTEMNEQQRDVLKQKEEKKQQKVEELKQREEFKIHSVFHGDSLADYQGRSYLLPPTELKPALQHQCFIPKKIFHNYPGHSKQVWVVRFYPKYGHFILSGSFDNSIKLWDVNTNRKCMQTYYGHQEGVRDLMFTADGFHFLSGAYDKLVHYWDTETGKVVHTFDIGRYPYCIRLPPDPSRQHSFLLGSQNKKIQQYDLRSGTRTQQYNEHLSAVNTVTFFDGGRKFASSSDDKKIFIWEFGVPVVLNHIAEPDMYAIVATTMHPTGQYYLGQSSDNKIDIYDTKAGKFRLNKKKKFRGHVTSGFAIMVAVSPDGQYVLSGDQDGKVWIWDWKTTRNLRVIEAHQGACMAVEWHPREKSKIVTAGWDGGIRIWD